MLSWFERQCQIPEQDRILARNLPIRSTVDDELRTSLVGMDNVGPVSAEPSTAAGGRGSKSRAALLASARSNLAVKRHAFLDMHQQKSAPMPLVKGRSKDLAKSNAEHADLLAAADAMTGDRVIALQTIVKIVQNAHKDAKCQSVKSSSKGLQEKVLNQGGGPLLMAAGFEDRGETWELSSKANAAHLQTLLRLLDTAQKPPPAESPFGKTYRQPENPSKVYFQSPLHGRAVLHFVSPEQSYILFGMEQSTPVIMNLKVQSYDNATRTLHGNYMPTVCACGSCGWSLELAFSSDFKAIERGSIFKTKDARSLAINLVPPWSSEKGAHFVDGDSAEISLISEEFEVSAVLVEGTRLAVAGDSSAVTVLEAGLEQASKASNVSPSLRSRLHTILACMHNTLLQYSDAVHHYEAAHALMNTDANVMFHVGFGVALLGADRPADAITHLEAARHSAGVSVFGVSITNHTASACALAMLGASQLALAEMDSAIASLEAALPHMSSVKGGCATPASMLSAQSMEMYIRTKLGQAYEFAGRLTDAETQQEAICKLLSDAPTLELDLSPKFAARASLTGRL